VTVVASVAVLSDIHGVLPALDAVLSGLSRHWEAAYPDPVVANNHDSSDCQIFGNLLQVGQNDGRLLSRAPPGQPPDQEDGRAGCP
jgi:hypothetical protein